MLLSLAVHSWSVVLLFILLQTSHARQVQPRALALEHHRPSILPALHEVSKRKQTFFWNGSFSAWSSDRSILDLSFLDSGLTFDRCSPGDSCKGSRQCLTLESKPCNSSRPCFCLPRSGTLPCTKSESCEEGEVCASNNVNLESFCVSSEAVRKFSIFEPLHPLPIPGDGLTFSGCKVDVHCNGNRYCAFPSVNGEFKGCNRRKPCFCVPPEISSSLCLLSSDCQSGETCANYGNVEFPICVSKKAEQMLLSVKEVGRIAKSGLTFDPCEKESECKDGRSCFALSSTGLSPCSSQKPCACLPKQRVECTSSDDCITEEVCAATPFFSGTLCVSQSSRSAYRGFEQSRAPAVCPVLLDEDPPGEESCAPLKNSSVPVSALEAIAVEAKIQPEARIVGGLAASCNLAPYLVAVTNKNVTALCTGTLLSSKWVITAAHCEPEVGGFVIPGSTDLKAAKVAINIKEVFYHPKFEVTPDDMQHDISVIKLEREAPVGSKFMKLNAKKGLPVDGAPARSIGYGDVVFQSTNPNGILRQVDTRIVPNKQCNEAYKNSFEPQPVSSELQICAGTSRGGCGVCQGDSGGPLVLYQNGEPIHIGVPSYTVGCGDWDFPGVFTRTSAFLAWMKSNTTAVFETN